MHSVKEKTVDFTICMNSQATLTRVDQSFCDYLSISPGELVGHSFAETIAEFQRPQFQKFISALSEKKSTGSITLHHKNNHGVLQPIHWVFQPDILDAGIPVVMIASGFLAYELDAPSNLPQHSRAVLGKTALDSVRDIVFITDQLDRIVLCNQKFKRLLQPELQYTQILENNLQSIAPFLFPQYEQDKQAILQSLK